MQITQKNFILTKIKSPQGKLKKAQTSKGKRSRFWTTWRNYKPWHFKTRQDSTWNHNEPTQTEHRTGIKYTETNWTQVWHKTQVKHMRAITGEGNPGPGSETQGSEHQETQGNHRNKYNTRHSDKPKKQNAKPRNKTKQPKSGSWQLKHTHHLEQGCHCTKTSKQPFKKDRNTQQN